MRELKFRAWDKQFKRMKVTGMGINGGILSGEDIEIMQYTGLKDCNDKEIYEGDIVMLGAEYDFPTIHTIVWCGDHDYPAFDLDPDLGIECNGLSNCMAQERIEVIGNIYENPKLVKQ